MFSNNPKSEASETFYLHQLISFSIEKDPEMSLPVRKLVSICAFIPCYNIFRLLFIASDGSEDRSITASAAAGTVRGIPVRICSSGTSESPKQYSKDVAMDSLYEYSQKFFMRLVHKSF